MSGYSVVNAGNGGYWPRVSTVITCLWNGMPYYHISFLLSPHMCCGNACEDDLVLSGRSQGMDSSVFDELNTFCLTPLT